MANNKKSNKFRNYEVCDEIKFYRENGHWCLIQFKVHLPVIDGVGYLKYDDKVSLVFVQISLSNYSNHDSKLTDLFIKAAPENKSKTLLTYYRDLCPSNSYLICICVPNNC